jgi:hypothetical protein
MKIEEEKDGSRAASGQVEQGGGGGGASPDHRQDEVTITVDNKPVLIHRGRQPVSEIKRLGGVPQAFELEQVIEGEPLKPLPDDSFVVIKGGEQFVGHPRDSGSSAMSPGAE